MKRRKSANSFSENEIPEKNPVQKLDLKKSELDVPKQIVDSKVDATAKVESEQKPGPKFSKSPGKKSPAKNLSKSEPVKSPESESPDQNEVEKVEAEEKSDVKNPPKSSSVKKKKSRKSRKLFNPKRKASGTSDRLTPEPKRSVVCSVNKKVFSHNNSLVYLTQNFEFLNVNSKMVVQTYFFDAVRSQINSLNFRSRSNYYPHTVYATMTTSAVS